MTIENQFSFLISSMASKVIEEKTNNGKLNHISAEMEEEIVKEVSKQREEHDLSPDKLEITEEFFENIKDIIHDLVTEYNNSKPT